MGVALIVWGRFLKEINGQTTKITIPAPSTDPGKPWLWDFIAEKAEELRLSGFTAIQAPPCSKVQGGDGVGCDGYGVFDPRDIGNKNQQGSINTRYGSRESLMRAVAMCHAVGMDFYVDLVFHQRIGANKGPGTYRYLGSDGKTLNGRGPMNPGCFREVAPAFEKEDQVPNVASDFSFGDEIVYEDCVPKGYTEQDALDWANWLFRTLDADGGRVDDVKGTFAPFIYKMMTSDQMADKWFYFEYFDGPDAIAYYEYSDIGGRALAEDLPIHFSILNACNFYTAWPLSHAGYAATHPTMAITMVENPDTDTSFDQNVIFNKLLGYAFLLTNEGYPFVYGKDYFDDSIWPGAYGLKPWIDNLIWIHENLAFGTSFERWVDDKVYVRERLGYPGLLLALNFDTWNERPITVETAFGANVELQVYSNAAKHANVWTDSNGNVSFTLPANSYSDGQSYFCFSRVGYGQPFEIQPIYTTQSIYGSDDLDIPLLKNGATINVGRIYVKANTTIKYTINIKNVTVNFTYPNDVTLDNNKTTRDDWVTIELTAAGLLTDTEPFELRVTYLAPTKVSPTVALAN